MVITPSKNKVTVSDNEINGRYKSLIEASPNGIATVNKMGIVTFCNSTFLKLTGFSESEIVGKHLTKLPTLRKKDIPKYLKLIVFALKGGDIPEVDFVYITKSGEERNSKAITSLVKEEGKVTELLLILRDTTVEKNAEKALDKYERDFRNLIENTSDIIMRIRAYPKLKMEYISPSVNKVLGYSQKEHYKIDDLGLRIVRPDDSSLLEEMLKGNHDFKKPITVRFNHKKGNIVWLEFKFTSIYNRKGQLEIVECIARDITELKTTQHKLEERAKEIKCLYVLSNFSAQSDITLENIFQKTLKLIPSSWQYPENTCVIILFNGKEYKTRNYKATKWRQSADIKINGKKLGTIKVYYLKKKPDIYDGPFLKEERGLINGIADIIIGFIERKKSEKEIKNIAKFPSENPNPVGRIDLKGKILYGNKACKIKFKEWNYCLGGDAPKPIYNIVKKMIKEKSYKSQIIEVSMGDKIYEFTVTPVVEAGYINIYGRDLTKKKKAEASLKESEAKYRSLYLSMNEGVCLHEIIYDKRKKPVDYIILDVNNAYEKIIGLKRDQVIGKKATDAYGADDAPYIDIYEKVTRTGKSILFEAYFAPLEKHFEISVFSYEKGKFVTVFLDITDRKNAELQIKDGYAKLQKTFNNTIKTLASLIETRDPYTSGHQKRVAKLTTAISKEMGFTEDKIKAINISALLHDIGKINIPASTLAKPGKLSDIEYEMIKTHPRLGYDVLKNIEFPWPVADIVLQHHEREDGSGYPNGLKGKDILTEAKILIVADTVEAMSSHRPYRPALGIDKAIAEIKKNKGKLYDPKIVDACVLLFEKKNFKF